MVATGLILSALFGPAIVWAAPPLATRQSISTLTAAQVAAFKPYTRYASSAYCMPANTLAWNCGGESQKCIGAHVYRSDATRYKKRIAMPTQHSSLLPPVATALELSSGMWDMIQRSR